MLLLKRRRALLSSIVIRGMRHTSLVDGDAMAMQCEGLVTKHVCVARAFTVRHPFSLVRIQYARTRKSHHSTSKVELRLP